MKTSDFARPISVTRVLLSGIPRNRMLLPSTLVQMSSVVAFVYRYKYPSQCNCTLIDGW